MNRIPFVLMRSHILLCLKLKDFLQLRLVSREIFKVVTKASIPVISEDEEFFPRATMLNTRVCMACERVGRMEQKSVPYDTYPRRVYIYCRRFDCFTKMLACFLQLTKEENRLLLYDCSWTDYNFDVYRSAGGTTPAKCSKRWKHLDGKVRALWRQKYFTDAGDCAGTCYYHKDVFIADILPPFLSKVLSFYN